MDYWISGLWSYGILSLVWDGGPIANRRYSRLKICATGRAVRGEGVEEIQGIFEIGFLDGAGFVGEGEGVWVGGDGDGGDLEEFLFEVTTTEALTPNPSPIRWARGTGAALTLDPSPIRWERGGRAVAVFPAEGDEADGDGVQKTALVEAVGDLCHWVGIYSEFDLLIKDLAVGHGADFS